MNAPVNKKKLWMFPVESTASQKQWTSFLFYFVLFKGRQMATGHLGQIIDVSPNMTSMCYLVDKPKIGSFQGLRSLGPKVNMV